MFLANNSGGFTMDKYRIVRYDEGASRLSREQLEETLERLPISFKVIDGHDLSLTARVYQESQCDEPVLNAEHGAGLIVLRPAPGKRLADGNVTQRGVFEPSRVMDPCTGGGACCSYSFNTGKLGLPYEINLMFDIHLLG